MIGFNIKEENVPFEKFRIFLSNTKSSTFFNLNDFNMDHPLVFSRGEIKITKVKVSERQFLEENPHSNCKNYLKDNEYHMVSYVLLRYELLYEIFSVS